MIPAETSTRICHLFVAQRWTVGAIARELGVHHSTVRRALRDAGHLGPVAALRTSTRATLADPFVPFLIATLEQYPSITASRLYDMVKSRGYTGARDHFRSIVRSLRPLRSHEAYLRLETLPGDEAQVDWGSFGHLQVGRARRPLSAFVMVLSYSRKPFLRFFLEQRMPAFLQGHVEAFASFGGVPHHVLYDNLKSAVLERDGQAIRFNPALLALASHYGFLPKPVAPARGNEKGRVERLIRYVRSSFFSARSFTDLDDLNRQAEHWCATTASERPWPQERSCSVDAAFERERPHLGALPPNPFCADEIVTVAIGKTPYARFDCNDYSVPHDYVGRQLVLRATSHELRLLDADRVVATHRRSFDRGATIEEQSHVEALEDLKHAASRQRGMGKLQRAVPNAQRLLCALAERGSNLGSATAALLRLLQSYGQLALEEAIDAAIERGTPHPNAVRRLLETQQQRPPLAPVELSQHPELQYLVVKAHDLSAYDELQENRHE